MAPPFIDPPGYLAVTRTGSGNTQLPDEDRRIHSEVLNPLL